MLGDDAVTEGWAFLLEHLVADPAWLGWQLDLGRSDEYLRFHAVQKLWYVRRYSAKLAYEMSCTRAPRPKPCPSATPRTTSRPRWAPPTRAATTWSISTRLLLHLLPAGLGLRGAAARPPA